MNGNINTSNRWLVKYMYLHKSENKINCKCVLNSDHLSQSGSCTLRSKVIQLKSVLKIAPDDCEIKGYKTL